MLASSNGLIPVDLLDCYKQYDPKQIKYYVPGIPEDPWHLNARGHLAVADYLYQFLQNNRRGLRMPLKSENDG